MSKDIDPYRKVANCFGPLSVLMLNDTKLSPAWRVSFVANFFTGPIYRDLMERFGLSRSGFVILFSLSQEPRLVARDIGRVTGLPKNSISRAVSELSQKRLLVRDNGGADRREKPLSLTEEGRALLAEVVPLFQARQTAMFAVLSADERAEFDRLMDKIIRAMPDWVDCD